MEFIKPGELSSIVLTIVCATTASETDVINCMLCLLPGVLPARNAFRRRRS